MGKCGQVEPIEETAPPNSVISAALNSQREIEGDSVEESKEMDEQSSMEVTADSRTDGPGDNAGGDTSLSTDTASDSVLNAQTNNGNKETTTLKVLQRGRKVSYKNGGSLNCDLSNKIMNKDNKLKFSNGKEETKERGGK